MSCNGNCSCTNGKLSLNKQQTNTNNQNNPLSDDYLSDDDREDKIIPNNDIIRTHYKQGYVDGITNAKETSLQDGFDDGFPKGAELGIEVGRILSKLKQSNDEFNEAKKELNITNVLNMKYFDDGFNLIKSSHELIVKYTQKP